ncbi:BTAD domain-containing putative transcriptional regulator [Roseibium sp.]|uniref:BTAD domain-containing putative transcriptional regulator n=1 Tax=Roseibium sp. TaxID=1936156 RepID=UPI003A97204B
MTARLIMQCLGSPQLVDDAGAPVAVATRKSLAILAFLLLNPENRVPREQVADILWSNAPREKAIQSLRQAVRQLRKIEQATGVSFLIAGKTDLAITGMAISSDLTRIFDLIDTGEVKALELAQSLLRGGFMNGFDNLDPVYGDWLIVERQRVLSDLMSRGLRVVDRLAAVDDLPALEAGCHFLLKLDGACEHAHRLLIKTYLSTGRKAEAQQQMKRCEAELRAILDVAPEEETLRLFDQEKPLPPVAAHGLTIDPFRDMAAARWQQGDTDGPIRLPRLMIASFANPQELEARALSILDDIRTCLGAYRNIQIYESDLGTGNAQAAMTMVEGGDELGTYMLRFRYDDMMSSVYLQLENRVSGQVLFNEVIDLKDVTHARQLRETASQTVNRIQARIVGRLRGQGGSKLPFSRWCQAEALLCEFNRSADKKALTILKDLQKNFPSYSVAYAGMASIGLKELLHYPDNNGLHPAPSEILDLAERAVFLDPWHVFCQRMRGWSLLQSGFKSDAHRTFAEAARLNPFDPTNLMSVAEGLAYIGEVSEAEKYSERAFSLLPVVPRFFYEYLANIQFAAGAFETTLDMLNRASQESMSAITTKVAALACSGREKEAYLALADLSRRSTGPLAQAVQEGPRAIAGWLDRSNLYQDPTVRANYTRGVDLVRGFLTN